MSHVTKPLVNAIAKRVSQVKYVTNAKTMLKEQNVIDARLDFGTYMKVTIWVVNPVNAMGRMKNVTSSLECATQHIT